LSVALATSPPTDFTAPGSAWRRRAIFLVMVVGQFLAILDIQVVTASLAAIQGGLSASPGETDWIQTAYLMAELVMIPLSAWLARALTSRWVFAGSAALFAAASLLCGLAWDLPSMVAFRALQGFVGGAMIPLAFATGFAFFEGAEASAATAALGLVSTLAPALGPAVGGWITDSLGWRWLFFVNVVPGAAVAAALAALGAFERSQPRLLLRVDWLHAASLAALFGGLQFVLAEGPRRDWFADRGVAAMGWTALVGGAVFVERCLYSPAPIVSLAPLRQPGFVATLVLALVIGVGLYTAVFLTPLYLADVRGFASAGIGTTVAVAGVFMALSAAPAAWLAARVDLRLVAAAGLLLYAAQFWMLSAEGPDWGFWELFAPQALRGPAVLLTMVPVFGMALRDMPEARLRDASGLSNLMRNLGGAVGIAAVATWLARFAGDYAERLDAALGRSGDALAVLARLAQGLGANGLGADRAGPAAASTLIGAVRRQALSLAFDDVYRLLAWLFLAALLILPFCPRGALDERGRRAGGAGA